jgi:hypothetical protein
MKKSSQNDKKLEEYKQSKPQQLLLFEIIAPNNKKYSNTIELYDFIPKYHWGKAKRINDQFLPLLKREFECRGSKYKVVVTPARIESDNGIVKEYYPSKREELVEDALRKLLCEGQGLFLDEQAGVTFTLYQLEQELKRMGHGYNKNEIKEALRICKRTGLVITTEDGKTILESNIFETLVLQTDSDWKSDSQKTQAFVRFNSLVTSGIKNKVFRQLNYEKTMSFTSVIARQLYKRMSHHYIQASIANSYSIMLSTLIRDFGLTAYTELRNNLRDVKVALEELKKKEAILNYKTEKIMNDDKRNKLVDTKFLITPHPSFCSDIIRANEKQKEIHRSSQQNTELSSK